MGQARTYPPLPLPPPLDREEQKTCRIWVSSTLSAPGGAKTPPWAAGRRACWDTALARTAAAKHPSIFQLFLLAGHHRAQMRGTTQARCQCVALINYGQLRKAGHPNCISLDCERE